MFTRSLILKNFRLFGEAGFDFSAKNILLFGRNGSGKTTVLEALYLLANGRTPSQQDYDQLVHKPDDFFSIRAHLQEGHLEKKVVVHYQQRLKYMIDDKPAAGSQISDFFATIFFSAFGFNYYLSSHSLLRRLFDFFVSGIFALYNNNLLDYNKALRQKNFLLKKKHFEHNEMSGWNKVLAQKGIVLVKWRKIFLADLVEELSKLSQNRFEIEYHSAADAVFYQSEDAYQTFLCDILNRECQHQAALYGPHRDRYQIFVNQKPMRFYSSGERKKFFLLLYFAYLNLFKQRRGFAPVFLFDDFDAAMDRDNLEFLWQRHPDVQIIATSVRNYDFFDERISLSPTFDNKE